MPYVNPADPYPAQSQDAKQPWTIDEIQRERFVLATVIEQVAPELKAIESCETLLRDLELQLAKLKWMFERK